MSWKKEWEQIKCDLAVVLQIALAAYGLILIIFVLQYLGVVP